MTEQTTEITAYERSVALVKAELTQYKPKQIDNGIRSLTRWEYSTVYCTLS